MSAIDRAVEAAGSQDKLAAKVRVTQGLVSQWVNGAPIPHKHFPAIEAATGVTAYELLVDELEKLKPASRKGSSRARNASKSADKVA